MDVHKHRASLRLSVDDWVKRRKSCQSSLFRTRVGTPHSTHILRAEQEPEYSLDMPTSQWVNYLFRRGLMRERPGSSMLDLNKMCQARPSRTRDGYPEVVQHADCDTQIARNFSRPLSELVDRRFEETGTPARWSYPANMTGTSANRWAFTHDYPAHNRHLDVHGWSRSLDPVHNEPTFVDPMESLSLMVGATHVNRQRLSAQVHEARSPQSAPHQYHAYHPQNPTKPTGFILRTEPLSEYLLPELDQRRRTLDTAQADAPHGLDAPASFEGANHLGLDTVHGRHELTAGPCDSPCSMSPCTAVDMVVADIEAPKLKRRGLMHRIKHVVAATVQGVKGAASRGKRRA